MAYIKDSGSQVVPVAVPVGTAEIVGGLVATSVPDG